MTWRPLPAREFRVALVAEGAQAFFEVLAAAGQFEGHRLVLQMSVQIETVSGLQKPFFRMKTLIRSTCPLVYRLSAVIMPPVERSGLKQQHASKLKHGL